MKKMLIAPLLLICGCLIAGLYGAVHDQISYTVSPEYFHSFKFDQFGIEGDIRNRFGAAVVGFLASWWVGLIIGVPILLIGLVVPGHRAYARHFLIACLIVIGTALVMGLGALTYGFVAYSDGNIPDWAQRETVKDQLSFARVGLLHEFSYDGGYTGMVIACLYVLVSGIRQRRAAKAAVA